MTYRSLLNNTGAVTKLHAGEVIAYPTEAVYGLGCDPRNELAVRKILSLKDRPESAGLVLIASTYNQVRPWIREPAKALLDKALQTWPGPVTWLFPRAGDVPDFVAGQHPTVAVRVTAHAPSRALCDAFGSALISTSANHASQPPARSVEEVEAYFGDNIGGIVAGALGSGQRPSEIRDLATGAVLRKG